MPDKFVSRHVFFYYVEWVEQFTCHTIHTMNLIFKKVKYKFERHLSRSLILIKCIHRNCSFVEADPS